MVIVKRSDDEKGFVVLPRRLVVERTFSWFGRNRRLAKDFENLAETLATFATPASIHSGGLPGRRSRTQQKLVELMARFPRPRPSDRSRFGEGAFARTSATGETRRKRPSVD
jgi:hypothetical protein